MIKNQSFLKIRTNLSLLPRSIIKIIIISGKSFLELANIYVKRTSIYRNSYIKPDVLFKSTGQIRKISIDLQNSNVT